MELSGLDLREWGTLEEVPMSEGHQVRQFTVNPGAQLPKRLNDYQCEHWVIVKGVGRVQLEAQTFLVDEGSSVFIPARASHAVENVGDVPLRIVAVHFGPEWPSAGARYDAAQKEAANQNDPSQAAE